MNHRRALYRLSAFAVVSTFLLACSQPEKHPKEVAKPVAPTANQTAAVTPPEPDSSVLLAETAAAPKSKKRVVMSDPPPPIKDPYTPIDPPIDPWLSRDPIDPVETLPQNGPFEYVDEVAEFPGGMSAMKRFIAEHLTYPTSAYDAGIQGKCFLRFVVSKTGEISNITVRRGVVECKECDDAAIKMIVQMPRWNPGKVNGEPVDSYYSLPIIFKVQ